ncbi:hypothetical protein [Embleya sp. NPDC059259]
MAVVEEEVEVRDGRGRYVVGRRGWVRTVVEDAAAPARGGEPRTFVGLA